MPLIEPVSLRRADELGALHFIAVGGAGMSGIAAMYAERGVPTSGSDQAASAVLTALAEGGVRTYVGHRAEQVGDAQTVVVSSAIRPDNPELVEAHRRGLRIWHRSAALAALMLGSRGVAVTGTHGKTTTSAMIATVLSRCGHDPSYVVGSPLTQTGRSYHHGSGPAFVVEADESDGSFLQYPAEIVVITNIEADHLDNWGDPGRYADGFLRLATHPRVAAVVISGDDPGAASLIPAIRQAGKTVVSFGESASCDVRLSDIAFAGGSGQAMLTANGDRGALRLEVPGRYNLLNAAAAYAVGRLFEIEGVALREAMRGFAGTRRRFQSVAHVAGVRIFDDYAHHPTEVRVLLTAARELVGDGRLVVCFQPHLFTRTRDFATEFGAALALADQITVLGIYPAREDPLPGVTGELVARAAAEVVGSDRVQYAETVADGAAALATVVRPGDVVVTVGAGDVTTVGPALARRLGAESGQ